MAGLTVQNFLSAATGIALAVALVRAFARSAAPTVGNFFADVTRATLYVLLPLTGRLRRARLRLRPPDRRPLVGLLAGIILILGGLQFFPALALGPIAEHVQMLAGKTF